MISVVPGSFEVLRRLLRFLHNPRDVLVSDSSLGKLGFWLLGWASFQLGRLSSRWNGLEAEEVSYGLKLQVQSLQPRINCSTWFLIFAEEWVVLLG